MSSWQFSKKFPLPKDGGHFEFSKFAKNGKTEICFYLVNSDRPTWYLSNEIFKKLYSPQNHFEFLEFLPKIEKHKFTFISLTM